MSGEEERKKIVGRAGVVGAGTLLSRILGFGRDIVITALFPSFATDAFAVALTIPNALRALLAEGAVSSAVVPVLSKRLAEDGDEAGKAFFARARGVSLVALTVVSLLGVLFARPITALWAKGYASDHAKFELTVSMTQVMFPYIFFMGTAALGMAALNAKKHFLVPAFAPALFSVGIVGASLALRTPMALAYGVMIGGVLQVVVQLPALKGIGYTQAPKVDFKDPHVREMLRRILPMTFGLGVYYVDLVLSRSFLSELGEGAQSWFFWASRICDLPQGIFVMAISSATLPSLATFAAKGEMDEMKKTWAHGMRLAMFVAIPCSVALAVLGGPLVTLMFQRGHFDALAAHQTARALAWQGGAIFTVAATRQLVPAFHSVGDTRTPVIVSALDLLAFIGLAVVLKGPFGHVGISMAVAGSSAVQMLLLVIGLRLRLGRLHGGEILGSGARVAIASGVAGAAAWAVARLLGELPHGIPGIVSGLVFAVAYAVAAWGLGAKELAEVGAPLKRRLLRRR